MLSTLRNTLVAAAVLAMAPPSTAQGLSSQSKSISEVWSKEEAYWRFVQAGDVEGYLTLWHDQFMGWPSDADHPATKASIANWVREIRDKKTRLTYSLTLEGARDFGNIVIVYYRADQTYTDPDGHVEKGLNKATHTWLKVGSTWQIIGGMAGDLPNQKP